MTASPAPSMTVTTGHVAIQCEAEGGHTGTFLFAPGTSPRRALSPIFSTLVDLYPWLRKNGWDPAPRPWDNPCGVYRKTHAPC